MKNMSIKLFLDIIMTILLILLMDTFITGMAIHELIGIGVCILFIIHNFINFKWIKGITISFFSPQKKLNSKIKFMYILNILLGLLSILMLISGLLISTTIFTSITTENISLWTNIHNSCGYLLLILISIHIGLHWTYIMNGFNKMFNLKKKNIFRTIILDLISLIIVFNGIGAFIKNDVLGKILSPFFKEKEKTTTSPVIKDKNLDSEDINSASNNNSKLITLKNNNSKTDNITLLSTTSLSTVDSLEEYLGGMTCTGCGKRCSLLSPKCRIGEMQAENASQIYYSESEENYNSSDNDLPNSSDSTNNNEYSNNPSNKKPHTKPNYNTDDNTSNSLNEDSAITANSLDEYLGGLNCTACGKHCSLLSPQCGKGVQQANMATETYNSQSNNKSTSNDENSSLSFTTIDDDNPIKLITDYISIMSIFIAGTHFIIKIKKK